jgi:hypothetical protein
LADEGFGRIGTVSEVTREGEKRVARYSDEHKTRAVKVIIFFNNFTPVPTGMVTKRVRLLNDFMARNSEWTVKLGAVNILSH